MGILFVGNTVYDIDSWTVAPKNSTGSFIRDVNFSPQELQAELATSSFPDADWVIPIGEAVSGIIWIHFRAKNHDLFSHSGTDGHYVRVYDGTSTQVAELDLLNGQWAARAVGDTTVEGDYIIPYEGLAPTVTEIFQIVDMRVEVNGSNIIVDLYHEGELVSTATAANTGGKGNPAQLELSLNDIIGLGGATRSSYFSEIIVTDNEPTTGWRLAVLEPTSAGNYQNWGGNHVEIGDNDRSTHARVFDPLDKLSSVLSTYNGPVTKGGIRAICAKSSVQAGSQASISRITNFLRISAADYPLPSGQGGAGVLAPVTSVWSNNPATGVPWDSADISGIEVGCFSGGSDEHFASVSFLPEFDGVDAATAAIDDSNSAHSMTFVANAQLDTAQKKFGTASLLLDGTGDYISMPDHADWNIGANAFTLESFVRFSTGFDSKANVVCAQWAGGARNFTFDWVGNLLRHSYSTTGSGGVTLSVSWTPTVDIWYHVAVCRDGSGDVRFFVDGVKIGSTQAAAVTYFDAATTMLIGRIGTTSANDFMGWIDEFRMTNGVGRYGDSGFAVPIEAFPRI